MPLSSRTRARDNHAVPAEAHSDARGEIQGENVRLVARMYEVLRQENVAGLSEILDPEFEWVNPSYAVHPGTRRGLQGLLKVIENLRESFDHQEFIPREAHMVGDDRVLWEGVFSARGRDSGVQVEVEEQHLWTLRDGRILRLQWFHDAAEARRAAGL
jgi:ketosteroid isomerase-like protein